MGRAPVQRYKDVDLYVGEIEDVYDVVLEFEFEAIPSVGMPMVRMTIKGWDKDDTNRSSGPLLYHRCEVPAALTYKRQQGIIRGLTEVVRQCLELLTRNMG